MTGATERTLSQLSQGHFRKGLEGYIQDRREYFIKALTEDQDREADCRCRGALRELRVLARLFEDVELFVTKQTMQTASRPK